MAPLAAFTMAGLLFVYSRSSIQAAKRNAQRHREADGGQINWNNENLRRHGQLAPPDSQMPLNQKAYDVVAGTEKRGDVEKAIRERTGKGRSS
jgi:hypothetical protein